MNQQISQSGYIAIVGRPNVGKSTLLNRFLGKKLSITSRKPQTTRHRILGVKTLDNVQLVYVDTPGLHVKEPRAINRYMNRAARAVLHDVDLIIFVVDAGHWDELDAWVLQQLKKIQRPIILALNKVDRVANRAQLLPYIEARAAEFSFHRIIPISAKSGLQVEELEQEIIECLPNAPHYFPPDQFTDRSDRFVASEVIREKLMRSLGQELPYLLTATIEAFEESPDIIKISAIIWVERKSQKAIIIGKAGAGLKEVGKKARLDLETYFAKKVFLKLWVKVKSGWSDDERTLNQLGYNE